MKRLASICIVLTATSNLAIVRAQEAADLKRSCQVLTQEGQYDRAMIACAKAVASSPGDLDALLLRGALLLKLGQREAAIHDFDEVLRMDRSPLYAATAFERRGLAHFGAGRIDSAAADFDAALRIGGDIRMLALFGRGLVRLRRGDSGGAAMDFAAARTINPDIDVIAAEYGVR